MMTTKKVIFYATVFILFSMCIALVSIILYSSLFLDHGEVETESKYQYQEIFSTRSTTPFVRVQGIKELSNDEFLAYQNSYSDSTVIISNFAESQFTCTGSCVCSSNQRRAPHILTRSLYVLISAISTSVAARMAQQVFHNQCETKFSSTCDSSDIQSEVSSCSEAEENDTEPPIPKPEYAYYLCSGHCLPKVFKNYYSSQGQKYFIKRNGKCQEIKTQGIVKIPRKKETQMSQKKLLVREGGYRVYKNRYAHLNTQAQTNFAKEILGPYCKGASRHSFRYLYPGGREIQKEANMCVGTSSKKNSNANCNLISENKIYEFNKRKRKE